MIHCLLFLLSSVWDAGLGYLPWRSVFKVVKTVHQQLDEIVHHQLLTLSHWLHDMFSYISNSVNLILINFSRAGYPGQFLQQCTMHLRLMVWQTAIAIKSLIMMSNFGTSTFLSSDLSAFFFNWFFTSEQKQSKSNLVFWWWYKNIQNKHQTTIWSRII